MSFSNEDFEQRLKNSFEHYELPYLPNSWDNLECRLNKKKYLRTSRWVALAATATLVIASSIAVYFTTYHHEVPASKGNQLPRLENTRTMTYPIRAHQLEPFVDTSEKIRTIANTSAILPSRLPNDKPVLAEPKSETLSTKMNPPHVAIPAATKNLSVVVNVSRACTGTEVVFDVANGPKEGSYLWNFGDGNFSNQPNPRHKYTKPGVFDVSLSVTNKKDGHIQTTVADDLITINPSPVADFEWEFVNGSLEEPTVKIINTSDNASDYQWKFEDGSKSKVISPIRSYSDKGKQMIALEVSNEYGCKDGKIKYIAINQDYNLMAPERFSAQDETFMPEALKQGKLNFKLTIYNGEKAIFETTNKNKGWNGTLPDGTLSPTNVQYPWIVIISNDITKEEKYFSGLVTVIP